MKKYFFILAGILFLAGILYFSPLGRGEDVEICDGKYVLLEMNFNSGSFDLLSKSVETGCYTKSSDVFDYNYNLISGESVLESGSFDPSLLFVDNLENGEMEGGAVPVESGIIYLKVPYNPQAENFEIYSGENKIFETKIYDAGAGVCRVK